MVEIEIIGNVGREDDIQVVTRQNGSSAIRFSLAGTTGRGEKAQTAWYTCFYSCDAKFKDYMRKGMKVFVRGEYTDRLYTTKDNQTIIDRTISVHKLEFCESKPQEAQAQPQTARAEPF